MKNLHKFTNLLFLALLMLAIIGLTLTSCQKEVSEIITPQDEELITADASVVKLMKRASMNDGSRDNIIDRASCFNIKLPVTVHVNSIQIIVDSEEDFEVIESILDELDDFDNDYELNIEYPIVIVLSDFSEIEINNHGALEQYMARCQGEDEEDDDIECVDFAYPLTYSFYDSRSELLKTVVINSDRDMYRFLHHLKPSDIVTLKFPVTVLLADGTEEIVENLRQLEEVITYAKDICYEDDNNDYDDDDCRHCTVDRLRELLLDCKWSIGRIKIDDVDHSEQYIHYRLSFFENGTLKAEINNEFVEGQWDIKVTDRGIFVVIGFEHLTDFNFEWRLYEIHEGFRLDFRTHRSRLKIFRHCEDRVGHLQEILMNGDWEVAHFENSGENETEVYNDFVIDFLGEHRVVAERASEVHDGKWEVGIIYGMLKMRLNFDTSVPFDAFNKLWKVHEVRNDRIELKFYNEDLEKFDKLVLEKII